MIKIQRWIQVNIRKMTWFVGSLIVLGFINQFMLRIVLLTDIVFGIGAIVATIPIMVRAYQALKVRIISIELLVTIASIGALLIGEYDEAIIVTFLFLFGEQLESKTLAKTRESIRQLTKLTPTTANIQQQDGSVVEIEIDEIKENDTVIVKAGDIVPVDGVIIDGQGLVNESALTGEARLVEKKKEDDILSASALEDGHIRIKASKVGDDTLFAKIIALVEEAQDSKSQVERFIDHFAQYYTPTVLVLAIVAYIWTHNLNFAITFLVSGCPGALVIGAPVSNVAGIGNGAKHGILIKGGEVMNQLSRVDTLVFDKTGTLTQGKMTVAGLVTVAGYEDTDVIAYAAFVEQQVNHPLGQAIVAYGKEQNIATVEAPISQTTVFKGKGVLVQSEQHQILVGNQTLLIDQGIEITHQLRQESTNYLGQSLVFVAVDQMVIGLIAITDQIRPELAANLQQVKRLGIKHLVMLTGDNEATAKSVGDQVGITEVYANLLPDQKAEWIKNAQENGHIVGFVGDGINDSPALASATVGIAMGNGTDVAIETADVVLMQSNFSHLVHALRLAKKTVTNMKENTVIAILVVIFLLMALFLGMVHMAVGMFVHEFSILIVILNAMRLIGFGKQQLDSDQVISDKNSLS